MPDADDFDVEYFRELMRGSVGKESQPPPAKTTRRTVKAPAAKVKPAAVPKKRKSR